jgi:hypothetical protein
MKKTIYYVGLDVHKNSIAVGDGGELRSYGTIGGKLADLDKLIKKLEHPGVELRFCYEAGPTGFPSLGSASEGLDPLNPEANLC